MVLSFKSVSADLDINRSIILYFFLQTNESSYLVDSCLQARVIMKADDPLSRSKIINQTEAIIPGFLPIIPLLTFPKSCERSTIEESERSLCIVISARDLQVDSSLSSAKRWRKREHGRYRTDLDPVDWFF